MGPKWAKKQILARKKIRRGWGGKNKGKSQNFSILAANSNGLRGKFDSLKNNINHFKPSCVLIQESKLRNKGTLKLNGYQIFELNRQGMGGRLFTAVDENLSPVLISADDENEIMAVQVQAGGLDLRIINAYGPQEGSSKDEILNFWHQLESQVLSAKDDCCGIIIELDANAKLGADILSGDPNEMSHNGRMLLDMVNRQNLIIGNLSNKCKGNITRYRKTVNSEEKSILDYLIFCDKVEQYFNTMLVDEKRMHVLKKYVTTRGVKQFTYSDHNTIYAEFSIRYTEKPTVVKREMFNLRNQECLKKFSDLTSITDKFSRCFNPEIFFKTLDDALHQCFKKIRITSKNRAKIPCEIQNQLDRILNLKLCISNATCKLLKESISFQLEDAEEKVTNLMAERNTELVNQHISQCTSTDGNFNQVGLWKLKSKILPRPNDPPMAKRDSGGNLITAPSPLKSTLKLTRNALNIGQ